MACQSIGNTTIAYHDYHHWYRWRSDTGVQGREREIHASGKEVLFTEKCPALGAKGDLILADLSQYAIGMRKEIALDRSNVPGWMEDMTDYRVIVRVDGQGTWINL